MFELSKCFLVIIIIIIIIFFFLNFFLVNTLGSKDPEG